MASWSDESSTFYNAGARYTLARRFGAARATGDLLSSAAARAALAGILGPGRDPEIAAVYHDLVRGLLRPVDGDYIERMRGAILDAVDRGDLQVFEVQLIGSSTDYDVEETEAPRPATFTEKAHELVFQVTCEVTGNPLPVAPYMVLDEGGEVVASGRTNRNGEVTCSVPGPGQYRVVSFPNDRVRLELELLDDNFDPIADTDVTFLDAEGNERALHTNVDGAASCDGVQCGLATITVGEKSAKLYVDSEHSGIRRIRVPGYFAKPPAWSEYADHEHPESDLYEEED